MTGTYSAGKSTLCRALADALGVRSLDEPARTYFESLQSNTRKNDSSECSPSDVRSTILPIHAARLELEESLDPSEQVVLDTAIPDTLAYALLYDLCIDEVIGACGRFRYCEPILALAPLPFVRDSIRNDDYDERASISFLRAKIYELLGYSVVTLPPVAPAERCRDALLALARAAPSRR